MLKSKKEKNHSQQPQALIEELDNVSDRLTDLIQKINQTSVTNLENDLTIADALAQRDSILLKCNIYNSLIQTAAVRQDRLRART